MVAANVIVKSTFWGAATNSRGEFEIPDLPFGKHILTISVIGFSPIDTAVVLSLENTSPSIAITMKRESIQSAQIVVTASRSEQDIMDLPLSLSVVSPKQIYDKNVVSLEEVLLYESGVTIIKDQLNIRGASGYTLGAGSRSLLLLDGVPLMGSASGNITWNVIPASEIDRVEIVKSGGSAMYGSGAMGGVVNIITRNAPDHPESRIRFLSGAYSNPKFDQWNWRGSRGLFSTTEITHATPLFGHHGVWVRLQRFQSDGYTELGWKEHWNATAKTKLNFGKTYSASFYGNFITTQNGVESQWKNPADPFQAPLGAEEDYSEGTKLNIHSTVSAVLSPFTVLHLKGALYNVYWKNNGTNSDQSNENKLFGEIQGGTKLSRRWHLTSGLNVEQATIDASIFGEHTTSTQSLYGLIQGRHGLGLSSVLGGRLEAFHVDKEGKPVQFAPQIGLNFRPKNWISFHGSMARGFRSPTVAELFSRSQLNVFKVEPNPGLATETSVSTEVGFIIKQTNLMRYITFAELDMALYSSKYEDMIEPTPDSYGVIHFENVTNATISGLDLGYSIVVHNGLVGLQGAYTYLNPIETAKDGSITDTLSYRYRHHFTQTTSLHLGTITVQLDSRHTSKMEKTELFAENPATGRDRRVPLNIWNMGILWEYRKYEIRLRVENLFQQYYVELERNLGEERNFQFSLIRNF